MQMKKAQLRAAARHVLAPRYFSVEPKAGPGLVPGARLLVRASEGAQPSEIAVRTSLDREVGLARHPDGRWATLSSVDGVVVVAPSADDAASVEVLGFKPDALVEVFDGALKWLERRNRKLSYKAPIFVRLDKPRSKKSAASSADNELIYGLSDKAEWRETIRLDMVLRDQPRPGSTESFVERVKREFAALNGVDVSQVVVEFRITA